MKSNKANPSMGRFYWLFAVMFVTANAQFAYQGFKSGGRDWNLVSIPFIVILATGGVGVLILIKRHLTKSIRKYNSLLAEPRNLRSGSSDDPWTYCGSCLKEEVDGAVRLLETNGITHEVKLDLNFSRAAGGWSGPYCLWIRDEQADAAQKLLVPYFNGK